MTEAARLSILPNPDERGSELWTAGAVKEALVEAFVVIERTTRRVGPRREQSAWSLICDLDEVWELRRDAPGWVSAQRRARPVSPQAISRAEQVLFGGQGMQPWLRGPLAATQMRDMLEVWVLHEVGKDLGYTRKTLQSLCRARGWAWSSFKRDATKAASQIADRLNQHGIAAW